MQGECILHGWFHFRAGGKNGQGESRPAGQGQSGTSEGTDKAEPVEGAMCPLR